MRRRLGYCIAQYSPQTQWLADLDRAVALGAWGVRLDIVPCYTANGEDLHQPAAKITAARARGLKVLAMLPHWTTVDKVQHKDGATLTALGLFTARVVSALGLEIATWELGNEPNIPMFAPNGPDPVYQAAVTAVMVKNLPTGAHIVSPGLAAASDSSSSLSPATFAARYWAALDAVTKARMSGTGIHVYGTPKDIAYAWSTYHQLPDISKAGGGRPLEITESNGYATATPAQKAVQYADALSWLSTASLPIGRVFLYEMSDQGSEPSYGVYDANGIAQPLLPVLQQWKGSP